MTKPQISLKMSLLLIGAIVLSACQNDTEQATQSNTAAPTTTTTDTTPTYVVMSELSTTPFFIRDQSKDSGITGFEYDLLNAIAEQQGFKLRFEIHPWQGLFDNLDTGKADILAGAVTYTDERAQLMDFTNPHFEYHYTMMVRDGLENKPNFQSLRGMKIALQRGSVSESLIPMFANPDGRNIVYTDTIWLASKEVFSGYADAAVGSSAPLAYFAKNYSDSKKVHLIQDPSLPAQKYAFAVKKGNQDLQQRLNTGLAVLKANGTYDKLYQKYW